MALVHLSKALNHNCFVKSFALPARLLVDDTHAYILTEYEGGNPDSAKGVGGIVSLIKQLNQLSIALTLKWLSGLVMLGNLSFKNK